MSTRKKTLIIALDGFTWNLGKPFVEEGVMPFLGRFLHSGCHGVLDSVMPFETSPAWSTFQTGCAPGKTNIYAFHTYDRAKKEIRLNSYLDIMAPTLWEIADNAGKKIVSMNMPVTSPPPKLSNGIIIPGLLCPGLSSDTVWPAEVFEKYIRPQQGYNIVFKDPDCTDEYFIEQSIKTEQSRTQAAINIMNDVDWDIFCIQMQSTDAFQHHFWGVLADSSESNKSLRKQVCEFYRSCDGFIKSLVENAGQDTLTIMVSDHGFCGGKTTIGINVWLRQNGYLHFLRDEPKGLWQKAKNNCPPLKAIAKQIGPILKKTSSDDNDELFVKTVESHLRRLIDLDKSTAFCLGGMGGILYINADDTTKKKIADEITSGLMKEFGPDSSQHVIEKISPAKEIYGDNPTADKMPDLVITFVEGAEHRIEPSGDKAVFDKRFDGTHSKAGFFAAIGKDIKHTQLDCSIPDIAPTVLAWMGIDVPSHMDGRVIHEMFESRINENRTDVSGNIKKDTEYSDAEQADVEKQLRDLGYL